MTQLQIWQKNIVWCRIRISIFDVIKMEKSVLLHKVILLICSEDYKQYKPIYLVFEMTPPKLFIIHLKTTFQIGFLAGLSLSKKEKKTVKHSKEHACQNRSRSKIPLFCDSLFCYSLQRKLPAFGLSGFQSEEHVFEPLGVLTFFVGGFLVKVENVHSTLVCNDM